MSTSKIKHSFTLVGSNKWQNYFDETLYNDDNDTNKDETVVMWQAIRKILMMMVMDQREMRW